MARRSFRSVEPRPRSGSLLQAAGRSNRGGRRRGRRPARRGGAAPRGRPSARVLGALGILALVVGALVLRSHANGVHARAMAAQRFAAAWAGGDQAGMWRALTPRTRRAYPEAAFARYYETADRAAGVQSVRTARPAGERRGQIPVAVAVATSDFGTLRGTVALPVSGRGAHAGVDWDPSLRLPGLRQGERVARRSGPKPVRAPILAADGTHLDATALGAGIAGRMGVSATGLEQLYAHRLGGHPSELLIFGSRVLRRTAAVPGRSLRTTIRPNLMAAAGSALGSRLGGIAAIRPSDGGVLALAGLAASGLQPPGSTFKIITVAAALEHGIATPSSGYPVARFATLSGVRLTNASSEACGGSLTEAFIKSCNSVFAPLGARLGAERLIASARAFGFGEEPRSIPGAKPSTIAPPSGLRDSLAVGAAAIGQDRDLATPLEMASVAATIALDGRRVQPRIAAIEPIQGRRVVSVAVAHEVRAMMLGVVRAGTGTAAALPGVEVAGKTGTAELRPNSKDPRDADAWFVAFAPAAHPTVAVAVMLVGAGFGGTAAAPIAKQVLQAALGRA